MKDSVVFLLLKKLFQFKINVEFSLLENEHLLGYFVRYQKHFHGFTQYSIFVHPSSKTYLVHFAGLKLLALANYQHLERMSIYHLLLNMNTQAF